MVTEFLLSALCAASPGASGIRLSPVPGPKPGAPGLLAFSASAPWMKGTVQLRMPETLQSSQGLHFIDHSRADMPPLSLLDPFPAWRTDLRTGALSYEATTREGVRMRATARPERDRIDLEFQVTNGTGRTLGNLSCQMCLVMTDEPLFGQRLDLDHTYTWIDGAFASFGSTTPTPAEKRREPWVLMLTKAGARDYPGPRDYADGWWVVDQVADLPAIARVSSDGKHLIAIHWGAGQRMLMTNTRIPCLHAGPTLTASVEPGRSHTWRGAIYLMENDPAKLRAALKRDGVTAETR